MPFYVLSGIIHQGGLINVLTKAYWIPPPIVFKLQHFKLKSFDLALLGFWALSTMFSFFIKWVFFQAISLLRIF